MKPSRSYGRFMEVLRMVQRVCEMCGRIGTGQTYKPPKGWWFMTLFGRGFFVCSELCKFLLEHREEEKNRPIQAEIMRKAIRVVR